MKVLFDTNIYISEALVGGLAERIIEAVREARWRIIATDYIAEEAERVLRDKLGFGPRIAAAARNRIRRRTENVVLPSSRHRVDDEKDIPILQAAVAAGVDYLVSDDRHLLRLHPYEGIEILSMRAFARLLNDQGMIKDV